MDTEAVNTAIGEHVHQLLWSRRLTQKAAAEALGLSTTNMGRRLRGVTSWQAAEMVTLAAWLGMPIQEVLPANELCEAGLLNRDNAATESKCTRAIPVPPGADEVHHRVQRRGHDAA